VLEEYEADGKKKTRPVKLGMEAVQRDGMEYEFDIVADLDLDNTLVVSKTRCSALRGAIIEEPGLELADTLRAWLAGEKMLAWDAAFFEQAMDLGYDNQDEVKAALRALGYGALQRANVERMLHRLADYLQAAPAGVATD
jgi:hypothetical protein